MSQSLKPTEEAQRSALDKQNSSNSRSTDQKAKPANVESREALLACVVLAKFMTQKGCHFGRISKADVLSIVDDIRSNRLRSVQSNGHASIVVEGDKEKRVKVSLRLRSGSLPALVRFAKEDPKRLSEYIEVACRHCSTLEQKFTSLVKEKRDIIIQSVGVSWNKSSADIIVDSESIVLA